MLLKDFFFSFKNIHLTFLQNRNLYKFARIGITIVYKFFILELLIYNFFYKKNLDKISINEKELFNKDLKFYKSKNKNNYLIQGLCDYSEIVFIQKKH